jgi:hypothetical protein
MFGVRCLVLSLLLLPRLAFASDNLAVEPADPTSNSPVTLIVTQVDCCAPAPVVTRSGFTISVVISYGLCFCPPMLITHRIALGVLPPGRYEVVATTSGQPAGSLSFVVLDANNSVAVGPSLGSVSGATLVNVTADVQYCANQPVTSCPPPVITFDGLPAANVQVIDRTHFHATTPPHATGAVEVRIVSNSVAKSSYAFRYFDPQDAPLPELFERVLFPVVYNGPGAQGSNWTTELAVRNGNPFAVEIWKGTQGVATIGSYAPARMSFDSAPGGVSVAVPREAIAELHFAARVRETSREGTDWGTEIPIVREGQFSSVALELLDIPGDRRYRTTLRIYSISSVEAFAKVTIYSMADAHILLDQLVRLVSPNPCNQFFLCNSERPAFAAMGDVTKVLGLTSADLVGIRVASWTRFPLWAFATVTNNDTQHVTAVSPQ